MKIRPATMDDAEIVLEWRNDDITRANSFSKDIIDKDSHMNWYQRKIEDENCFLYIMENESEKIGQIRIDKVNDIGEVSYMIAPIKRGHGYGKQIIKLCESVIPKEIKTLIGLVEDHNIPSKKCFVFNEYAEFFGGY